jgi:hypothetical protein
VLAVILFVLGTGCPWAALPPSLAVTRSNAHRRYAERTKAGFFVLPHHAMLDQLGQAGQIDWSRAAADAMQVRAVKGEI